MRVIAAIACLTLLAGCATVLDGTGQDLAIATTPPGARCDILRQDAVIASIPATPGKVYIRKSKHDLTVTCAKPGFSDATAHVHSGIAKQTAYDSAALFYGPVGWAIDSATGADNKYDPVVTLGLQPQPAPATKR